MVVGEENIQLITGVVRGIVHMQNRELLFPAVIVL